MGVMSTYCQICGLPVQQDHYVPAEGGGYFHIWRGDGADACDPIVAFGPEHTWLRTALGLRYDDSALLMPTLSGLVHDGWIETPEGGPFASVVYDGAGDDRIALHEACWRLAGQPTSWAPLAHLEDPAKEQDDYRQQLFDFESFVADGHGWMLVDPDADSAEGLRSRQRILGLLGAA